MVVMGVTSRGVDSGTSVVFTGEVVTGDWDIFVICDLV
jgi:hypothetical protein